MKKSEQKALEEYPMVVSEQTISCRQSYSEGYDQALQDFLEKAERYIENTLYGNSKKEFIDNFKNYIQDESEN